MAVVAFALRFTDEAESALHDLEAEGGKRLAKVARCLARLETNPRHPGLNSHPYVTMHGPGGEPVWESYVENRTPGAWRVWWHYGPGRGELTILVIGRYP